MKNLTLRASVALACALSLAACGGNNGGTLLLGGTVNGLTRTGLVLQNNGGTPLPVAAGSPTFAFTDLLKNDEEFNVTIQSSPASAVCTVTNGKGRTGAFNITNVQIDCITTTHVLGGKITGLGNAEGLVLNNGADRVTVPAGATSFTMTLLKADGSYASGKVAEGATYGITVLQQPAGLTCSVQNGSNAMGTADVTDVQVTCG